MADLKSNPSQWKSPNELLHLQRLKQKQKALQARLQKPFTGDKKTTVPATITENEVKFSLKRKNPFSKEKTDDNEIKKQKSSQPEPLELSTEDSVFFLLANENLKKEPIIPKQNYYEEEKEVFYENEVKVFEFLPVDWSIKSKLRILSESLLPGCNLKTSQEASGLTSFVRCIDLQNSQTGLDISPGARFHQSTLYWQNPSLPWLTLFPRLSKNNHVYNIGEQERLALANDWTKSFRSLFQLVRARQCPYFYLCANSFTVLFRAAGISGHVETHAFLTPTTRGMRAALKENDIKYTMPLRDNLKKSLGSQQSIDNTQGSMTDGTFEAVTTDDAENNNEILNDEDEDNEEWLKSLGVDMNEIKRINSVHKKNQLKEECEVDSSDLSIVLIEGIEAQAFFNFLLNCKSTTTNIGRLAGIPPTLLSPVSFAGATLKTLQARNSKVRKNNKDYYSIELNGIIMPHVLPYLNNLFIENNSKYTATTTSNKNTESFSRASNTFINNIVDKSDNIFGKENLSDCGLSTSIVKSFCKIDNNSVELYEKVHYSKDDGGYTWC